MKAFVGVPIVALAVIALSGCLDESANQGIPGISFRFFNDADRGLQMEAWVIPDPGNDPDPRWVGAWGAAAHSNVTISMGCAPDPLRLRGYTVRQPGAQRGDLFAKGEWPGVTCGSYWLVVNNSAVFQLGDCGPVIPGQPHCIPPGRE